MRIALLTAHFAPDEAATAVVATLLADALANRGHDVWVGAAAPSYRPAARLGGPRESRVSVHRSRQSRGRLRTYANYHLAVARWTPALRKADAIVSMSPPLSLGTLAALLGTGKPTVYNIQDLFAEVLQRTGRLREGLVTRLLEGVERFTYERTTALVTVGESQRRFLIGQGIDPRKITTIENVADLDALTPREPDLDYRRSLGVPDGAFCALYAGNFGIVNDLGLLLDVTTALSSRPDIMFVFSGGGRQWPRAVEFARGRTNLVLVGHRPPSELGRLYAAADVGLVTLKRGLSTCSVPSKTYSILASGRPFVAAIDQDSDVTSIADRSGAGLTVAPGDAAAFAAKIVELAADRARSKSMGQQGYHYVVQNNSPAKIASAYEALLDGLIHSYRRV